MEAGFHEQHQQAPVRRRDGYRCSRVAGVRLGAGERGGRGAVPGGGRPARPNLLVILADDLGWADLSCFGAPEIRTLNLDRLAASGVRFTQSYSTSAVCSPTRFGLYTGRYPGRLPGGLPEPISVPNAVDGIPIGHPTLASLIRDVAESCG